MRNLFLLLSICCLSILTATSAFALSINVYNDASNLTVLEDFESYTTGFTGILDTNVGEFIAGGSPGTGATSNHGTVPEFSIQNDGPWYGRYNTTSGGSQWLDSGDITLLTLNVRDDISTNYNNLYFYMMDPSDCGATTTVNGESFTQSLSFNNEGNGKLFLVGIEWDDNETLESISFNVSKTSDGYGLDDFSTKAPVPEPATMFLLGFGLIGIVSLRKKNNK